MGAVIELNTHLWIMKVGCCCAAAAQQHFSLSDKFANLVVLGRYGDVFEQNDNGRTAPYREELLKPE